jgi:ATP-binding cassette, subfamily C, bacterial LapB
MPMPRSTSDHDLGTAEAPERPRDEAEGGTAAPAGPPEPEEPSRLPARRVVVEGEGERAAERWPMPGPASALDDPLLDSIVALSHLLERPTSPNALAAGLPLEDGRLTPDLAVRALGRAGLGARLMRRPLEAIAEESLPCVLLLEGRRACVLARRRGGRAQVVLPESGRGVVEMSLEELERRYQGVALFARPTVGTLQRERELAPERSGHWFWGTLLRSWPVYSEVLLAAALINLFALVTPLFVMNVYDRVVPNQAIETLWVLAIGAFTVFGFDFLLRTLRGYFVDSAGRVADVRLASHIFEHVLGIRMAARPGSAGAFASNLREFESLREFFTSATITTVVDLPFVVLFIAVIWWLGGPVALVPAIAVPLVILVGLAMQVPLNRVVRRTFKEAAQKHGVLVEAISGLETIKSVGAEGRMQRNFERFVGATARSAMTARLLASIAINFATTAASIVTVGVVVYGVYRIAEGEMTVGALVACTIIAGRAMAPLGQVAGILTRFHQAKTALEALDRIMELPVERDPGAQFLHRPEIKGEITFKDVDFTYPGQKLPALSGVSFGVGAGERVGLIGRIGSGKTTIEKLVLGLFEPQKGAVLLDGTDIRQIDPADLRRHVGCVPQDLFLFHGTLRENITLGAPHVDDQAVLRAATIAGVDDFARRHPMGYDMPVGERGEALSGGQRQAVAIARALLLDPPILLLDEPTSAMDNGAESRFKARLQTTLAGRTLVLVTHRASLLGLVDRLVVMDGGRVVADGPRDEVLRALSSGQIKGEA